MSIKVAVVGIGNCANSLLQGLQYYKGSGCGIGLVRPDFGGYLVSDIEVVAAFDVTQTKVGFDISTAIWGYPNNTMHFAQVPHLGVAVHRGPTLDGLGRYVQDWVSESPEPVVSVLDVLKRSGAQVLINYLPVGSQLAAEHYALAAIEAGCAVVNCMPVFLASTPLWAARFAAAGVPIIGDDIKSQVGATIVHRVLAQLFRDRGVRLDHTMQLNVGGNGDFRCMLERERLASKKISKTEAVVSISGVNLDPKDVHVGPSDYVEWLSDRKWAYIRLEGRGFGGAPIEIELKLSVWDSPNSAGIVIDAIRAAKLALDRGLCGAVDEPSAYFMKHPPVQVDDNTALERLNSWILFDE